MAARVRSQGSGAGSAGARARGLVAEFQKRDGLRSVAYSQAPEKRDAKAEAETTWPAAYCHRCTDQRNR